MTTLQLIAILLPLFLASALLIVVMLVSLYRVRQRERRQRRILESLERAARR